MTVRADSPGTSPYKGLAPFEDSELDALLFFGRDGEREVITANLQASRLTVLYGPSGCGKSSVLRAGVAHRLRRQAEANLEEGREPEHAVVVFDRWSDDPAEGIAAAVAEAITPLAGAPPDGNGAVSLSERVGAWARRLGGEVYLILDQAEEYFLYRSAGEDDEFARELPELVGRPDLPVNVLVSLREDALGRLDVFRAGIPTLFANTLRLALLDGSAARDAVVGPLGRFADLADAAGPVEIEPELVEAVLADTRAGEIELGAGGPSGLALTPGEGVETAFLQLVLVRLWQTERDAGSNTLRLETFQRLGGAERIVQDHLGAALAAFTPEQRDAAAAAFHHLVTPSGTKVAHAVGDLATYSGVEPGFLAPVLTGLAEQRILRPLPPADGSSDPRYEIFHDVLAAPILGWRAEHETERRLAGERREARRRHRRLLGVTIASLVGLAIAVGLAIFALTQRSEAREQAALSRSRELAANATSELTTDPELSVLLALEAAGVAPTPQAESALRDSLIASRARAVLSGHEGPVEAAEFSPDTRLVLTAGTDGTARIHDLVTGAEPIVLRHDGPVTSAEFDRSGAHIVTASLDGRVRIWSVTGEPIETLSHEGPVLGASFDAAGDRVLSWSEDGSARLWSSPDDRVTYRHGAPVVAAALSPTADIVVTGGDDGTAQVFDAATGRFLHLLRHEKPVTGIAFSPDGSLVATTSRDRIARIWQVETGDLTHNLEEHRGVVTSASFTPDGTLLVTTSRDGGARVWDVATGLRTVIVARASEIWNSGISLDGAHVVSGSLDGGAQVWQTSTGTIEAALVGHSDAVNSGAFSPNGNNVVTSSDDGSARVWDASISPVLDPVALLGSSTRVAFTPGGQFMLATPEKGQPQLLRLDTGQPVASFEHEGATAGAVSHGGALVATADNDEVRIWRLPEATLVRSLELPAGAVAVELDPSDRSLLVAGVDGVARVLSIDTGEELRAFGDGTYGIADASFSPDGARVAAAGDDGIARIWDAKSGELLHELEGHTDALTTAAFSPDGATLVTASTDADARIWDAQSGTEVRLLRGHFGTVFEAAFSPDGRWVVTAGPVIAGLWDAETGHLLFYLRGNDELLTGVAFDPTGHWIVTTNGAGGIRKYHCEVCSPIEELVPLAQHYVAELGLELTDEQREEFGLD